MGGVETHACTDTDTYAAAHADAGTDTCMLNHFHATLR